MIGRPTKIAREDVPMLAARYAMGETPKAIAKDLGVAQLTVLRALRDFGVVIRPKGRPRKGKA